MSYIGTNALQVAVYQTLLADPDLAAFVGTDIYDVLPTGTIPPIYVTIGDEDARDAGDTSGEGARVTFIISVVSRSRGYTAAKGAAAAVAAALAPGALTLTEGQLTGPWFLKSTAKRTGDPDVRRLDLTFEALVQETS